MSTTKFNNIAGIFALLAMVLFSFAIFQFDAVEISSPFLNFVLPITFSSIFVFSGFSYLKKLDIKTWATTGFCLGWSVGILLFLSNFLVNDSTPINYSVLNIEQGQGSTVNWVINTNNRSFVTINLHSNNVDLSTKPESVKLVLLKGWLGFYFGNLA